ASFDSAGAPRWSKHVGGNFSSSRVASGDCGAVVVATTLSGDADFGGGVLHGENLGDVAVADFDGAGAYVWATVFAASQGASSPSIAAAPSGRSVVSGDFTGMIDLGCGPLSPRGGLAAGTFVAELDSKGSCLWSTSFGGDKIHTGAVAAGVDGSVW